MLSIFVNCFYTKSLTNSGDCKKISEFIMSKLNNKDSSPNDLIEKFNFIQDILINFSMKLDTEKDNSYFINFIKKIITLIIRLKPMESVFVFSSLMVKNDPNSNTNIKNNSNVNKLKKNEKILEFQSTIFSSITISLYSTNVVKQIYNNILNQINADASDSHLFENTINSIKNKDKAINNLYNTLTGSKSKILINKNTNYPNNNENINFKISSDLIFKNCLMNILEFELILEKIKSLTNKYVSFMEEGKISLENLQWDFFEAENTKKNFKTKTIKESIKDHINRLNIFLKNSDVKIPIPNLCNLKKHLNEMIYIKSMSYLKPDDIFRSLEKPIKITLWSKNFNNNKSNQYSYILKKSNDVMKEHKSSQIFLSIHSMINFPQNKVEKEITDNFKCYEIVSIGSSMILIEFLKNTEPLKKKLSQVKSQYFFDHITQNLEFKLNHNQNLKEYLFLQHPRNLFLTYIYDTYNNPLEWYQKKKNFIYSYAVWSMCSYIVRLGDRHLENIMINDKNQLIYIDYGYVMNDGFNLPTPETLPVRFTNNLRYALGFLEETGVFLNTCYKVLKIIYKHSYIIIPQMKVILDNIKENAHINDNVNYDNDPNWMKKDNLKKNSLRY